MYVCREAIGMIGTMYFVLSWFWIVLCRANNTKIWWSGPAKWIFITANLITLGLLLIFPFIVTFGSFTSYGIYAIGANVFIIIIIGIVGITQVISARKIQLEISVSFVNNPNPQTMKVVRHITTQILTTSVALVSAVFVLVIFTILFNLFVNWILCQTGYLIFYILKMVVLLLITFPLRRTSSSISNSTQTTSNLP